MDPVSYDSFSLVDEGFPQDSLMYAIQEGCLRFPAKQMVVGVGEGITYASAYRGARMLAWYMRAFCGIGPESTVLLLAPNVPEYPLIMAAVQACAARVALLSPTAERNEIVRAISLLHPQLAIVSTPIHCEVIKRDASDTQLMTVRCPQSCETGVEQVFASFEDSHACDYKGGNCDTSRTVIFSSGSTGLPKAIVHRSPSFFGNAQALVEAFDMNGRDVLFLPVPFAHVYGVLGIYAAISSGTTIVTCSKYRPETALGLITSTRATLYFGVATMYLRELRANHDDDYDLSTLRAGLVAGSSCPRVVFQEYERRYGCRLMQSYGMTETAATLTVSSLDWPLELRASSVGFPIEGVELQLVEATGEILCKTPAIMEGIVCSDGSCDVGIDESGWFHSGDIGAVDELGHLGIVGRIKDIIIRGSINIYPAEVENAYQDNGLIAECCMVGYPDPDLGERTCLCAILKTGADESSHGLRSWVRGRIAKCKIPDVVLKMDELPRLPNGKIDKKKLREIVKKLLCA